MVVFSLLQILLLFTQSAFLFDVTFLAQVFCEPSFYTAALSTPANSGQNANDNPGHPDNTRRKKQIENCLSHWQLPRLQEIEQCGCRYEQGSRTA
jgi:hypothetical protein